MKKLFLTLFLIFIVPGVFAGTGLFQEEQNTGGLTKQCIYDYAGNTYVRTVQAYEVCPATIEIDN